MRASVAQFHASQYIISLNRKSESKVMAIWNRHVLPWLISSVSIYYWPKWDIRVKSYGRLNLPCASMFNFEHHDILYVWIRNLSEKLWPFDFLECFHSSISCVLIYYWSKSDIRVKSCGCLNFPCASMFTFEHLDILCAWIKHLSEMLWPYEFAESFRCSTWSVSICYWPQSDIGVKSYGRLNLPCNLMFYF